ncbi:MAG TPA: CHAT domain-containing protein [Syntrophales bacterium]|nr:CHAT domain-containing protein [Syntrophales bacterium]
MYLYQSAKTDFVLVDADWPVEKALKLVQNLIANWVIVQRSSLEHGKLYYLYDKKKFEDQIKDENSKFLLGEYLDLKEADAQVIPGTNSVSEAPDPGVVFLQDHVVGYWDPEAAHRAGEGVPPRSLLAKFPRTVSLNEERDLTVLLTGTGEGITIEKPLPEGAEVDIKVETKKGFEIIGPNRNKLVVTKDDTQTLTFRLKATATGNGEIQVWASLDGNDLAGLSLTPQVVADPGRKEEIIVSHNPLIEPASSHPDLSLRIMEQWKEGKRGFSIIIEGPKYEFYMEDYGFIPFEQDPGKYFEEFYKDIESFPVETAEKRAITDVKLKNKGNLLFEMLFPLNLRQRLWNWRKSINSIFILSDEPWIPWELCRLSGEVNGRIEEGDFWCEAFSLTRWIRSFDHQPLKISKDLTLQNLAIVVPNNSKLPYAEREKEYLLSLRSEKLSVKQVGARFLELQRNLASGRYDGWHFTGHGGSYYPNPDLSVIQLEDELLKPENLNGIVKNLGSCRPLVFLNACQIGQGGMSLTGIGGWASRFLAAGAGAFIGPLWSVYDQSACTFAKALYRELLKGITIGKAVRTARREIKGAGDPTWLAYTVFAYPMASVKP